MVPISEYQPYFTYQTISNNDEIIEHRVNAMYDDSLQRFYPIETIEIEVGTVLKLNYKTKVKAEFPGYEDHDVYERVSFREEVFLQQAVTMIHRWNKPFNMRSSVSPIPHRN